MKLADWTSENEKKMSFMNVEKERIELINSFHFTHIEAINHFGVITLGITPANEIPPPVGF